MVLVIVGVFICLITDNFIKTVMVSDKDKVRQVLAFMFMLIGSPCIYYGTEIGMSGGPDPDCRRCMIWDEHQQDLKMFGFMKKLINIRKKRTFNLGSVFLWGIIFIKRFTICSIILCAGSRSSVGIISYR